MQVTICIRLTISVCAKCKTTKIFTTLLTSHKHETLEIGQQTHQAFIFLTTLINNNTCNRLGIWGAPLPPSRLWSSVRPAGLLAVSPSFFVFLLHLHPAVLKPYFYLSLGQIQESGDFISTIPGEVHVKQKLFFQFKDLVLCVGTALFSGGLCVQPAGWWVIWKRDHETQIRLKWS